MLFRSLETIPLNRHLDDAQFKKILEGRQSNFAYHGKELVKSLVPLRAYEGVRALAFKLTGKH